MSHPTWVRGLKLYTIDSMLDLPDGHPRGVRGLKLAKKLLKSFAVGRTLRGCVD